MQKVQYIEGVHFLGQFDNFDSPSELNKLNDYLLDTVVVDLLLVWLYVCFPLKWVKLLMRLSILQISPEKECPGIVYGRPVKLLL